MSMIFTPSSNDATWNMTLTLSNYINTLHDIFTRRSLEFSSTKDSISRIKKELHNKEFNSDPQGTICGRQEHRSLFCPFIKFCRTLQTHIIQSHVHDIAAEGAVWFELVSVEKDLNINFKTLLRSILDCACPAWSHAAIDTPISWMQIVQNAALRIVNGCTKMSLIDYPHSGCKLPNVKNHKKTRANKYPPFLPYSPSTARQQRVNILNSYKEELQQILLEANESRIRWGYSPNLNSYKNRMDPNVPPNCPFCPAPHTALHSGDCRQKQNKADTNRLVASNNNKNSKSGLKKPKEQRITWYYMQRRHSLTTRFNIYAQQNSWSIFFVYILHKMVRQVLLMFLLKWNFNINYDLY